jgi:hypothetical protein
MKRKYSPETIQTTGESTMGSGGNLLSGDELDFEWPSSLASCPMDDLPCCVSAIRPPAEGELSAEELHGMQMALSWACTQIDCAALHTFRRHPDHLAFHMDWAFTRYLRAMIRKHPSDPVLGHNMSFFAEHCNFGGYARLWFPTQQALQLARRYGSAASRGGPMLECFVPEELVAEGSTTANQTIGLVWKALEWLCTDPVLGSCEGAVRELQLAAQHASRRTNGDGPLILGRKDEEDLLFRARLLFTLFYQVMWQFDEEDTQGPCAFEGIALLAPPAEATECTSPRAALFTPRVKPPPFRWPISLASCPYDDGLPCCRARNGSLLADMEKALSWACGQVDCTPLHTFRLHPMNISFHLDWAFSRYLRKAVAEAHSSGSLALLENNTFLEELCYFGGVGMLWVPRSSARLRIQQSLFATGDGVSLQRAGEGHEGPDVECLADAAAYDEASLESALCASGVIGSCDGHLREVQRTGMAGIRDGETQVALKARLLLTLHFQLHWPDAGGSDEADSSLQCGVPGVPGTLHRTPLR